MTCRRPVGGSPEEPLSRRPKKDAIGDFCGMVVVPIQPERQPVSASNRVYMVLLRSLQPRE